MWECFSWNVGGPGRTPYTGKKEGRKGGRADKNKQPHPIYLSPNSISYQKLSNLLFLNNKENIKHNYELILYKKNNDHKKNLHVMRRKLWRKGLITILEGFKIRCVRICNKDSKSCGDSKCNMLKNEKHRKGLSIKTENKPKKHYSSHCCDQKLKQKTTDKKQL